MFLLGSNQQLSCFQWWCDRIFVYWERMFRMFLVAFREVFCFITYFIGFKPFNGKIRELFFGNGKKRLKFSNNSLFCKTFLQTAFLTSPPAPSLSPSYEPCQRPVLWILNHLLCRNYKRRWYLYESNHWSTKHNGWT